ncbi:alanine racemase [Paenibacillus spongiae]|uniref:Alanine racemase n=1 Tax=Paenibacillus spongiae TaxID=2909671 RepID=A0ABY5SH66_9BACL|nr:alanine racemase [Paenibacillus spongiae]UVI33109.1 alanine racemase [Paenibacillus spongiae]
MHVPSYRDTWAEISLDAIAHNAAWFKAHIRQGCLLMAVVKADGYGHGAVETANAAIGAGAEYLGVALLDEALRLREAGIQTPILVFGYTPPRSVEAAVARDITMTVFSREVLEEIILCSERLNRPARIHIKVDTGMSRIGVQTPQEALALAELALSSRYASIEGLFTHLADADGEDERYTRKQFQSFMAFVEAFKQRNVDIPIKHCCNSAAAMRFPDMHLDMVRVGIALYGLHPAKRLQREDFPVRQAMSLKTRLSAIRRVSRNQPVSYGCTFLPERDSVIATIPIGYADGLSRKLSNKGSVFLRGQRVPIAGRVCMDQTMLDVTSLSDVEVGDEVTLFGQSGGRLLSIDEVADWMDTINYEVVCLIGKRVPRVYV